MRILYIDVDSLRPDHLGCYGYHRNTSPHTDALARQGVLFKQVYTSDAPCLPSRTAFYSGRLGIQTGVVGHGGSAAQPKIEGKLRDFRDVFDSQGLGRQLQKLGLHTAMISPFGQRHAAHWFYAGFNEIHNTGMGGMESAEHVQPVVDRWLADNAARDNWFLHVNYWDPHTPYRAPKDYGEPFANEPLPQWLRDENVLARHNKMTGPHTSMDVSMYGDNPPPKYPRQVGKIPDMAALHKHFDGYDTGIRYMDDQVGKIIAALKKAGVYDQTVIIFSADHSENQGELGIYAEHGTADVATCRVPLIIKWPGARQGQTDDGLHYSLDLAPTLMELLGGQSQPLWDGQSFAKSLTAGTSQGRDELILSQCCHVCQRSVRWNNWLYMRTYHDGFHLFPQEMLYDLSVDPYEQNNVAAAHPDICREAAWRLERWHDQQMQHMARVFPTDVSDPLWTVVAEGGPFHAVHEKGRSQLPEYIERLKSTGRAEGATALAQKYHDDL